MSGVLFIRCIVIGLDGFLQKLYRFRVDDMGWPPLWYW